METQGSIRFEDPTLRWMRITYPLGDDKGFQLCANVVRAAATLSSQDAYMFDSRLAGPGGEVILLPSYYEVRQRTDRATISFQVLGQGASESIAIPVPIELPGGQRSEGVCYRDGFLANQIGSADIEGWSGSLFIVSRHMDGAPLDIHIVWNATHPAIATGGADDLFAFEGQDFTSDVHAVAGPVGLGSSMSLRADLLGDSRPGIVAFLPRSSATAAPELPSGYEWSARVIRPDGREEVVPPGGVFADLVTVLGTWTFEIDGMARLADGGGPLVFGIRA